MLEDTFSFYCKRGLKVKRSNSTAEENFMIVI